MKFHTNLTNIVVCMFILRKFAARAIGRPMAGWLGSARECSTVLGGCSKVLGGARRCSKVVLEGARRCSTVLEGCSKVFGVLWRSPARIVANCGVLPEMVGNL